MQDVPKIVLKRLQETQSAGIHPDADLLTAFAERSLVESERARVMEHLARCSDCREVVAFTLPATELVAVAASTGPTRAGWFSWPVLRWSVAVAGIVAITSIGIVQYRQRQKSDTLVSSLTQPNETAAPEQALPPSPVAPESQADISQTEKEEQAQLKRKALSSRADNLAENRFARPANPTLPATRSMNGATSRSVTGGSVRLGAAGVAAPKAAPSSPRSTVAVAGGSKNATIEEAAKPAPSPSALQVLEAPPSSQTVEVIQSDAAAIAPTAKKQDSDHLVEKQKDKGLQYMPSTNSEVRDTKNPARGGNASGVQPVSPRWSISADGILQRSLDAGKTWVDVNLSSGLISDRSSMAITAESTYGHENKKKKVEAQPNPVFRAVSAQGTEVWAGGSAAVLYHSADSGEHWARVLPSSSGATLTGDITSVEFPDPLHGRIATSSGEVWITADHGQTWRRQ